MSYDDLGPDAVLGQQRVHFPPEVFVLDSLERLAFPAFPTVGFPLGHPFAAPLGDVGAIGNHLDATGLASHTHLRAPVTLLYLFCLSLLA